MEKDRHLTKIIKERTDTPLGRIIVLTGARQVGKTDMVQRHFADYAYLSIEDPIQRNALKRMGAKQWHLDFSKAALDEVQKEPELIESIKSAYDQFKDVKYILSGSSQILLLKKVRESLAGRCSIFELYPLCLTELQTPQTPLHYSLWQHKLLGEDISLKSSFAFDDLHLSKLKAYNYYLQFGGYPALVADEMTDDLRYNWLADYTRTYLERDLQDLAAIRDLMPFIKLQKAIALQTGQVVVVANLSRELNISSPTITRYIEYLGISYQTILLPSWERNHTKRLTKAPKIHFLDHGVLQTILNRRGGMSGNEYESAIVSEIYKQTRTINLSAEFYHLRTHDGREVDLLVETSEGYYAFEIKMAEHITATDARHLRQLDDIINDKPILHKFILSNDMQTKEIEKGITAIHAAYLLG